MTNDLASWVKSLRPRYGNMRKIAELIGMSESGFSRGVKRGTLAVENLLDLADATDTPPSTVLRLADKGELANRIEKLYGVGADALTPSQLEVLDCWQHVRVERRETLLAVLRVYRAAEPDAHIDEVHVRSPLPSGTPNRTKRRGRRGPNHPSETTHGR